METQFENRYHINAAMMTESMWAGLKVLKIFLVIAAAVLLVSAGATLYLAMTQPPLDTGALLRCAIGAAVIFLCWRLPGSTVKSILQEMTKQTGGSIPETVVSFGELIAIHTMGGMEVYPYERIRKVASLNTCYVIYIDKRISIPVIRTGFTVGDFDEFKQFLREKRPDLTIPE